MGPELDQKGGDLQGGMMRICSRFSLAKASTGVALFGAQVRGWKFLHYLVQ